MELSTLLTLNCTRCAVQGSSKKRILETISALAAAENPELSCSKVLSSLMAREKMGSTGVGNGIAIPHGRISELDKPIAILITCNTAINFDAIDGKPVDVLFGLIVPEHESQTHLSTLAAIAEKLTDKHLLRTLREASSDAQLLNALVAP